MWRAGGLALALLFGQELNAEMERKREVAEGLPAEREIQLPPRAVPKETINR